jgi:hypothetical protein
MYILTRTVDGQSVSVELTEDEVDAIYSSMDDYRHYGDTEEETASSIQDKILSTSKGA